MAEQIKYSFDKKSLEKMGKGMLYALAPSVIMGAIAFLQQAKWESTIMSMIMPFVIMVLTNVAKEWIKGIPKDEVIVNPPEVANGAEPTGGHETGIDKSF